MICSIFAAMVRIGRQIPHFGEVDLASVETVFSEDRKFRYLLTFRYGGSLYASTRSKKAVVILKNPSAANKLAADSTIRKVETFIYRHLDDVLEVSILNIFGLRATDAIDLNTEFEIFGPLGVIGPENDRTIQSVSASADYVIVAWGNRSGINKELYEDRIRQVKNMLNSKETYKIFEVKGSQRTEQPLHGMMWGYDHLLVPFQNLKQD